MTFTLSDSRLKLMLNHRRSTNRSTSMSPIVVVEEEVAVVTCVAVEMVIFVVGTKDVVAEAVITRLCARFVGRPALCPTLLQAF
jgi:hypothetical protein